MAKTNVSIETLREWKKAPVESHFNWLHSAIEFVRELEKNKKKK